MTSGSRGDTYLEPFVWPRLVPDNDGGGFGVFGHGVLVGGPVVRPRDGRVPPGAVYGLRRAGRRHRHGGSAAFRATTTALVGAEKFGIGREPSLRSQTNSLQGNSKRTPCVSESIRLLIGTQRYFRRPIVTKRSVSLFTDGQCDHVVSPLGRSGVAGVTAGNYSCFRFVDDKRWSIFASTVSKSLRIKSGLFGGRR